jgi:ubiquinone/menaquinone biosynthesis C-methylase UbiE
MGRLDKRIPEPELMDDPAQAAAYAAADFSVPHQLFVDLFITRFPDMVDADRRILDLGCGPADVTVRLARALPAATFVGVDGAPAMLAEGRRRVEAEKLSSRVELLEVRLSATGGVPPGAVFDAVVSNSLLHHLADPDALWNTIRAVARPGAPVLVMDLCRPADTEAAAGLVNAYAAGEPDVLRCDFYASLCAAYRPGEVRAQLAAAGFDFSVDTPTDRHLVVTGRR